MEISVHDNDIVSYEVRCEAREIHIKTEFRENRKVIERTDVVLTGVEAYCFQYDCMATIIFDIEEVSAEKVLVANLDEIQRGTCLHGPLRFWNGTVEEALRYFEEHGTRGFELSASYGMTGWVLAKEKRLVAVPVEQT